MIEIVYKDNETEGNKTNEIRKPKNVKQIGNGAGNCKIYIEDYAMNFVKRSPKQENALCYGILMGQIQRGEEGSYVFVRGAVLAKTLENPQEDLPFFSGDVWNFLYDEIKKNFDHMEIVGWYLSKPEIRSHEMPQYSKEHLDNFSGMDKLFLAIDRTEKEESFYVSSGSGLEKEDGYYIYYERNDEMQQYMTEKETEALPKKEEEEPRQKTVSFSVSSVAAVAALLAVVLLLNNSDRIAGLMGRGSGIPSTTQNVQAVGNTVSSTKPTESVTNETTTKEERTGEAVTDVFNPELEVRYYTVKPGETLYEICVRVYNNAGMVDTVRKLNNIDDDYLIREGQKIILP